MMEVWGYNADVNTRTLDMHIVRLRKKIEITPIRPSTCKRLGDWV
jgi:two-component system alkaline phosphatase synthesis response regulator PhoP